MKVYQSPVPRAAFAFAAIVMTAVTIAVTIVVPANMDSGVSNADMLARPSAITPLPVAASRGFKGGDVTGDCPSSSASLHHVSLAPGRAATG
jgi:hypothetical protein